MRLSRVVAIALFATSLCAFAEDPTKISGYVTRINTNGSIDVEGVHVQLAPGVEFHIRTGDRTGPASAPGSYYVGETLDVIGPMDRKSYIVTATQVILNPVQPASVHGVAVIDAMPPAAPQQPATEKVVRADGYTLRLTARTNLNLDSALNSMSDISTNQWIEYSGVQQLDGTVLCDYAGVGMNRVNAAEAKLREKYEYDPATVTEEQRQNLVSKHFAGVDPRKIPPFRDPAVQARVERIAQSLIPAYQIALPDSDPTKIHFRFQVVDSAAWKDAVTPPSGIITIPRDVVDRVKNDDQLAAVLADYIAESIEKAALRSSSALRTKRIGTAVQDSGFVLLGVGEIAGGAIVKHYANKALEQTFDQSGRVSLQLMHDAGYDITQAPIAWWLLASKKPEPIEKIKMPARAANLYMALGTTWHPAQGSTPGGKADPDGASGTH